MAATEPAEKIIPNEYRLIVLGGGSGGLATAKRAAEYLHPKTIPKADEKDDDDTRQEKHREQLERGILLIEEQKKPDNTIRLGGTCVNVGCVPKKTMWYTATMADWFNVHANQYGFNPDKPNGSVPFDFARIKRNRDEYVGRLNDIYEGGLKTKGIEYLHERTTEVRLDMSGNSPKRHVVVTNKGEYTADVVVIACGGRPYDPPFMAAKPPGTDKNDYYKSSDEFFYNLTKLPRKIAVVGAGYIAVELGQVMQMLGSEVSIFVRSHSLLRTFDKDIQKSARRALRHSNVTIETGTEISDIQLRDENAEFVNEVKSDEGGPKKKTLIGSRKRITGKTEAGLVEVKEVDVPLGDFDEVIYAIGRGPNDNELALPNILRYKKNFIKTDRYERCLDENEVPLQNVFAVGDINDKVALTPVAIRAGRALADREFGGQIGKLCEYENIPSVVFTHPPIGAIGLTERKVIELMQDAKLPEPMTVYTTSFGSSFNALYERTHESRGIQCFGKLVCVGPEETVVGLHLIGDGSDEMLQGFGVAIRMGATKADFDNVVAIHPTGSEEVVTMRGGNKFYGYLLQERMETILKNERDAFAEEAGL